MCQSTRHWHHQLCLHSRAAALCCDDRLHLLAGLGCCLSAEQTHASHHFCTAGRSRRPHSHPCTTDYTSLVTLPCINKAASLRSDAAVSRQHTSGKQTSIHAENAPQVTADQAAASHESQHTPHKAAVAAFRKPCQLPFIHFSHPGGPPRGNHPKACTGHVTRHITCPLRRRRRPRQRPRRRRRCGSSGAQRCL